MRILLYVFALLLLSGHYCLGQSDIEKASLAIVEEGKRLYASEMASWYGTDIFLEKFKEREKVGGYFSYSDNGVPTCIFFSKEDAPKVIGTITFDSTYNVKTAKANLDERAFSTLEHDLYTIRQKALEITSSDTLFKRYENSSLNLIPLLSNNEKKVYVLTGPSKSGVVIFGNDYLISFDEGNNLKSTKQLHANIIPVYYGNTEEVAIGCMHSHLPETGDLITATDICTTMLYQKFAGWETVYVMSKNYVSLWNCKTNILGVMTRKAFDKMRKK